MGGNAFLFDANLLIDFSRVDKSIIGKICAIFMVYVPDIILSEVDQLSQLEAEKLGIRVIKTPIEILVDAAESLSGCSYQDTVCFLMAKKFGWGCATNDKKLRKECIKAGIEVIRGFKILIILAKKNIISVKKAESIAKNIFEINNEISQGVLMNFLGELKKL